MNTGSVLLMGVLGVAVGALGCWWLIGSYHTNEPRAREKALWDRIAELQAVMDVPALFWQVWARYTDELAHCATGGKHAADSQTHESDAPGDSPHSRGERDCRP
jgi:hypothetical protein